MLLFYYNQIALGNPSPEIIKDYIATEALVVGINPQMAIAVAEKESQLNTQAIGDHGTSFGIWQIHNVEEKGLTKPQAEDLVFSTNWAMKTMKEDGSCREWSTCPADYN